MNSVTINKNSTYRISAAMFDKDELLRIAAGVGVTATLVAPLNWLIQSETSAVIANGQYVILQLNNPTKNQIAIIEGYALAKVPLATNTIPYSNVTSAPQIFLTETPVDLIVGTNKIEHDMGAMARQLSCTQNGASIGVSWNNDTTDPLNFVNIVVAGKPANNVSVFIMGFN